MKWIDITQDGVYQLSANSSQRESSTIYIDGDSPNGTFTFGILNDSDKLVAFPDGTVDDGFTADHGLGVTLVVRVLGYAGSLTRVGFTGL